MGAIDQLVHDPATSAALKDAVSAYVGAASKAWHGSDVCPHCSIMGICKRGQATCPRASRNHVMGRGNSQCRYGWQKGSPATNCNKPVCGAGWGIQARLDYCGPNAFQSC